MNLIKERRPKMNLGNNKKEKDIYQYDHYLAIDWSQENAAIGRMKRNSVEPKRMEIAPDIKEVKKYLSGIKGSKILTIEETTSTHWLYVELKETVDKILVCDPYRNSLLGTGPKTDKIDAGKLCQLLRGNLLHEVYHSLDEDYRIRKLSSAYEDLIKSGVRIKNQKSAIYRAEGLRYKKDKLPDNPILQFIEDNQNEGIAIYESKKKQYYRYFDKLSRKNELIKNQEKIPGIGTISAVTIYAIVIQASRFEDKYKYWAYCGLVLNNKESGRRSYGKRKPRCSRKLKSIYLGAALAATGGNNDIAEYFNHLLQSGLPARESRKAVARYIAKVSYGMLKTGEKYVPYKWRKSKEKEEVK
jgi:transposase